MKKNTHYANDIVINNNKLKKNDEALEISWDNYHYKNIA